MKNIEKIVKIRKLIKLIKNYKIYLKNKFNKNVFSKKLNILQKNVNFLLVLHLISDYLNIFIIFTIF